MLLSSILSSFFRLFSYIFLRIVRETVRRKFAIDSYRSLPLWLFRCCQSCIFSISSRQHHHGRVNLYHLYSQFSSLCLQNLDISNISTSSSTHLSYSLCWILLSPLSSTLLLTSFLLGLVPSILTALRSSFATPNRMQQSTLFSLSTANHQVTL